MAFKISYVKLQSYTWPKDSHGLFDYESKQHFKGEFIIEDSSKLYRQNNELHLIQGSMEQDDLAKADLNFLFSISHQYHEDGNEKFQIDEMEQEDNSNKNQLDNQLYYVVRGLKKNGVQTGYKLKVSDIIKVGRVKFIVREILNEKGELYKINDVVVATVGNDVPLPTDLSTQPSSDTDEFKMEIEQKSKEKNNTTPATAKQIKICKFCLSDESESNPDDMDDKLINLCKCKGSCEYTHYKCFKKWIEYKKSETNKFQIILNNCVGYNLKKLHCELCNEPFPYLIKMEDQEIEIIDIARPTPNPYLILERLESVKDCRALYVLNVEGTNELKIGRGHTNNILVNDISVSRLHASIKYVDGEFFLFDNNSKFGTLVLVQKPLDLKKDTVFLQCGKTVVTLAVKGTKCKPTNLLKESSAFDLQEVGTPSTTHLDEGESASKMETEMIPTQSSSVENEDINKKRRGRPKKQAKPVVAIDITTTNNTLMNNGTINNDNDLIEEGPLESMLNKINLEQLEANNNNSDRHNVLLSSKKITKRKRAGAK